MCRCVGGGGWFGYPLGLGMRGVDGDGDVERQNGNKHTYPRKPIYSPLPPFPFFFFFFG